MMIKSERDGCISINKQFNKFTLHQLKQDITRVRNINIYFLDA